MASYANQAPAEWDKQSAKFKKLHTQDSWASECWLQPKYDGVHVTVDIGRRKAYSRTGEEYTSMEHIVQAACAEFGAYHKVFLEAWCPAVKHPIINGWARREENSPRLIGMVFDAILTETDERPYWMRMDDIGDQIGGRWNTDDGLPLLKVPAARPGTWGKGAWADAVLYAQRLQQDAHSAFDGTILVHPNSRWSPGKTKNGEVIKIKPTLALDLEVVDIVVEPGEKTGRLVAVLVVSYRGIRCKVGSGVPHDLAGVNIGSIVEVEALGVTEKGLLREPRFKGLRTDKPKPD